ncbi:hypothetical protein REPUB_Repub04eG0171600 [Reevesia pubescens]
MQKMGMSSTSFSNSTFLFTSSFHFGIGSHNHNNNNTNFFLSFPFNKTLFSSSLPSLSQPSHFLSLSVSPNIGSNKLRTFSFKKGRKASTTHFEMDASDDDDEFFDSDDEFDGADDDDDAGMFLPLGKMKKWLDKKPRGFGERKVYDTSIEDKLLEEIEQGRQAQIGNLNNLKNNPVKSSSNKDDQRNKKGIAEVVPSGIRVKVVNLPKKKNIHRDLKAAFQGVSGIINISPAVSGNKKTKDPVCKGFAFVDFKREVDAARFVQNFSGHNLTFGRIQKQIKCEMMNSLSQNSAGEELSNNDSMTPEVQVSGLLDSPNADFDMNNSFSDLSLESVSEVRPNEELSDNDSMKPEVIVSVLADSPNGELSDNDSMTPEVVVSGLVASPNADFDMNNSSSNFSLESLSDEFDDQDDELNRVELGESRDNVNVISESEPSSGDDMERTFKHTADSISANWLERIRALEKKLLAGGKQQRVPKEQKGEKLERIRSIEKKVLAKGKQQKVAKEQKVQKLDIPGSAKRLKIKEKALLTGVVSKYGLKTALTSKEES